MKSLSLHWAAALALFAVTAFEPTASLAAGSATTLKDTISSTLGYNPNIKAFQEYRQAAEHDLKRARSGWFPRVDARGGYGVDDWHDRSTRTDGRAGTFYSRSEAGLTISQTIWDGMATWNRVNIGESRLESAKQRLYDNAEALGLDAALAHIEVYRQRRIVALAELNVRNHQRILGSQKERQVSGASTMADVTQIESRLARTQASLAESRSALEVAMANYQRLTGKAPAEVAEPVAPGEALPSLEAALARSMAGNLKIKALQSDVSSADSQAELDKASFYPQIFLEAGPSYRWRAESSTDDSWGTAVMLRANWNLFNGGYDWYNVRGSKARARQSKQELAALRDSLSNEVASTWSQMLSAQEQARHFANAVQYSTKTRDMYLEQFNVGQRSLLDVLDSENELFSSSIQYVTAQQNVTAAKLRLTTLGGAFLESFGLNRSALAIKTK